MITRSAVIRPGFAKRSTQSHVSDETNREARSEIALLLRWFPLLCFLCWAMDWRNTSNLYWVGLALLISEVLMAFFLDSRRGMYVLLCVLLCGQDILQSMTEAAIHGEVSAPSIWRLKIGPLNPSWVVFGILLCFYVLKLRSHRISRVELMLIVLFALTGIISFAYGNQAEGIERWASDLKFPAFLVLSLLMFKSYIETYPANLLPLALSAGLCWLARHFVDFCYLATGTATTTIGGVNRVSVDSAKTMVVFLLLWGIALVAVYRRYILGSLIATMATSLIVAYMTRTIWFGAAMSLALFGVLSVRYRLVSFRLLLVPCMVLALLMWVVPRAMESYVFIFARRVEGFGISPIVGDYTRFASSVNLLGKMRDDGALLWGLGYGGWYTDEYMPFPSSALVDAFDPEWISQGRFYRIHNVPLQVVFKHGIAGLVLFLYLWLAPVPALHNLASRIRSTGSALTRKETHLGVIAWLYLGFLPTALTNLAWSAKSVLISGFILALTHHLAREARPLRPNSSR